MADDISGAEVTALLNTTATSRQSDVNAAILLGELIKTKDLRMAQDNTMKPAASAPPNAAGAVDPLAR